MHILNKAQRKEEVNRIREELETRESSKSESEALDRFYRNEQSYDTEW